MKVLVLNVIMYTPEHGNIPQVTSLKDTVIYNFCKGLLKNGQFSLNQNLLNFLSHHYCLTVQIYEIILKIIIKILILLLVKIYFSFQVFLLQKYAQTKLYSGLKQLRIKDSYLKYLQKSGIQLFSSHTLIK